jgi:hypothetical protein
MRVTIFILGSDNWADVDFTTGVAYFRRCQGSGSKAACRATALKMIINLGPLKASRPAEATHRRRVDALMLTVVLEVARWRLADVDSAAGAASRSRSLRR